MARLITRSCFWTLSSNASRRRVICERASSLTSGLAGELATAGGVVTGAISSRRSLATFSTASAVKVCSSSRKPKRSSLEHSVLICRGTPPVRWWISGKQSSVKCGSPFQSARRSRCSTYAYHLGPLGESESRAYVEHRLRRADWKGDPHLTEDCFPLIHQRTAGVPRQINTLCSRLLLFGFLEELHTLTGEAVEKVANDLREEIAVVATPSAVGYTTADPVGSGETLSQISHRLAVLEDTVDKHGRVIKRGIEIVASYLQGERS